MGRLVATLLLMLCLISLTTCSLSTRPAAFSAHDLRRGLQQAARGRLLAGATEGGAVVPIHWSQAHYVANFTIGTPPQPASAIIDIAGELVWTQCSLCLSCFKQDLPLFVPNASSTFRPEPCGTDACNSIPTSNCSSDVCTYEGTTNIRLGRHTTFGIVGTDTFAIGTATASLVFGCVVASDIDTMDGPSGFIGLGRTPRSLVTQMNLAKFSYCLSPRHTGKSSRLFLGSSAKLAGGENTSTAPFIKTSPNDDSSQYYLLNLEAIKAGNTTIATAQSGGTLVMHTFSPISFLVDSAYQAFKKAVTEAVGAAPTPTPPQPFDLCFTKAAAFSSASAPDLVFMFQQGGAMLTVPPPKYLIDVGKEKDTVCMAILSMAWLNITGVEGVSVLGSLQQENVHFLFDLKKETLSFEAADCSSLP